METRGENVETGVPRRDATPARGDPDADGDRRIGGGDEARGLPSGGPATAEGMAKDCRATFEKSTCETLIEADGKPRDGSHEAIKTGDCTDVFSKAECEAIYAMRDQAAEAHASDLMSGTEFRECLEDLTPRCEKLLGPLITRQR